MNINHATSRRRTQLPPEAFARPAGLYGQLPIPRLARIAAILCALILAWNAQGSCAGPLPLNLDRPDYNYSGVTCMSCHFTAAEGNPLHTARAAGVTYNTTAGQWQRTGHGWWDSRHAQSQNGWSNPTSTLGWTQPSGTYGENDNTFCANCHSPLQASVYGVASISESGTTATVTLSAPGIPLTNIAVGDTIFITGNTITGYNNTETSAPPPTIGGWTVSAVLSTTQIQFVAASSGLGIGSGGTLGDTTRTSGVFSGQVLNPVPVLSTATGTIAASAVGFPGVWCSSCHPSSSLGAAIIARYPGVTLLSGGVTATLIRGANPALAASWIPILPGFDANGISYESDFCLTCHEQDPHNAASNSVYQVMYAAGVSCIDCHMAPFAINTGTTIDAMGTPPGLTERFHDWKVAENLPYSCGAQGSLTQYTCHSGFNAAAALAYIPFMTGQHSDWWSLPPFSTDTAAVSAHEPNATSDQLVLWREIQAVYGRASVKKTSYEEGARF
ncbi:MAG: hypothetical protein ABSG52_16705 [Terriglobales bacterium]|jgi:hypothetical protein